MQSSRIGVGILGDLIVSILRGDSISLRVIGKFFGGTVRISYESDLAVEVISVTCDISCGIFSLVLFPIESQVYSVVLF